MKIAVYTIAKNEEKYVGKWEACTRDADYRLIADTGSADGTVDAAHGLHIPVIEISVVPWRFDDARNAALTALPADVDVCISLDMDEVLTEGWRERVEAEYTKYPNLDRLRYNYIWSWNIDGTPGLTYYGDKIHTRRNFRWVGPVHEYLRKDMRQEVETQCFIDERALIEHYPDNSKPRHSMYLDLLGLAVKEDPANDRNAHYYARDLMFAQRYEEAVQQFQRHLELPTALWKDERATSLRYIGDCLWEQGNHDRALFYFTQAIAEAPHLREGYIARAQANRFLGNWAEVVNDCEEALCIKQKPKTYLCQAVAWSAWPNEMLGEALVKLRGSEEDTAKRMESYVKPTAA